MLHLARRLLGPLQQRVELHRGYIDTAPPGPYDEEPGSGVFDRLRVVPSEYLPVRRAGFPLESSPRLCTSVFDRT